MEVGEGATQACISHCDSGRRVFDSQIAQRCGRLKIGPCAMSLREQLHERRERPTRDERLLILGGQIAQGARRVGASAGARTRGKGKQGA